MSESLDHPIAARTPPARPRWLVTGANGFIGSRVVTHVRADGSDVRTFSRSAAGVPADVPAEDRVVGSLPDRVPADLCEGIEVVVHCAAWVAGPDADADAVNVDGTLRLADAALRAGVRGFVFLSTQSADAEATSAYGRTKFAAEQALRARFAGSSLAVVILRLGIVTGAGTRGFYRRLATVAERWPVLPLVGGGAVVQPIHVDDLCGAIVQAGRRAGELCDRVLHLGAPDAMTLRRFMTVLSAARSGRPKPILTVPLGPLIALARLAERVGLRLPVTSQNLEGARRARPMETRADMARLGVPDRSLDEMLREDLAVDHATAREADRLARYLVGRTPGPRLAARYARAVATLGLAIAPDEQRAWRFGLRVPRALRLVDGGLALAKPHGTIRRRLHAMLAVLEASPDHCDAFLPVRYRLGERLAIAAIAFRAGAASALGLVLVLVLGVRPQR